MADWGQALSRGLTSAVQAGIPAYERSYEQAKAEFLNRHAAERAKAQQMMNLGLQMENPEMFQQGWQGVNAPESIYRSSLERAMPSWLGGGEAATAQQGAAPPPSFGDYFTRQAKARVQAEEDRKGQQAHLAAQTQALIDRKAQEQAEADYRAQILAFQERQAEWQAKESQARMAQANRPQISEVGGLLYSVDPRGQAKIIGRSPTAGMMAVGAGQSVWDPRSGRFITAPEKEQRGTLVMRPDGTIVGEYPGAVNVLQQTVPVYRDPVTGQMVYGETQPGRIQNITLGGSGKAAKTDPLVEALNRAAGRAFGQSKGSVTPSNTPGIAYESADNQRRRLKGARLGTPWLGAPSAQQLGNRQKAWQ